MNAWRSIALGDLATIERSGVQPQQIKAGTTYVGLEHIESGGGPVRGIPVEAGALASSKFQFTERHLLYGTLRPYLAKIACPDFSGICSTEILPILPGPRIERRFLFHFLRQPAIVGYANSHAAGANLPRLSPSVLARLKVPMPDLSEQQRIAEVLDRAEALSAKRRAALAQIDTLIQAIFLDLFGELAGKGWQLVTISDVAHPSPGSIRTGPFGSQLLHSEFVDEGIVVLGIDNVVSNEFRPGERRFITEAKYRTLKRYTVRPGDVLITIMGTCGRCAVVPDHVPLAINTKHLCCITVDTTKCLPGYLHSYFLRHPLARRYLERTVKGAIMAGLNMAIIKEMPIPIPPIDIQREFVRRVASVEQLRASQRSSLSNMDALFVSLQHRAFRGEL